MTTSPVPTESTLNRGKVVAWSMWDWGSAAFNAVITTFVFTRWITSTDFVPAADLANAKAQGTAALEAVTAVPSSWLGWGLTAAGVVIALLAPVLGSRSDDAGRRKFWLGVYTYLCVACSAAMFLVRPDPASLQFNLLLGITLLAAGNVFFELASVNYNAMLSQVSTPSTMGKISGIGWGAGYIGGIVLLGILFVGFINPDVGWFGVTDAGGMDIRVSVLISAIWFAIFAIPVLRAVPEVPANPNRIRYGFIGSYRQMFADVARIWRTDRHLIYFLLASAVFRDGLAGVFTFGAVIASGTFGFSASLVIVFALGANVVAGLATFAGGWFDDRVGPKSVIVISLVGLLIAGMTLFFAHGAGQEVFWVFGLLLCVFVGPAQSASRSMLARLIPPGRESEMFGLYATTGRAASFMSPFAWSVLISVFGAQYWGILGIMAVLAIGLALLLPVRLSRPPAGVTA